VNETWAWILCTISWQRAEKLRVLTIRDAFSRLSAAIELRFNFRAARECERGAPLLTLVITYTFWSGMRVGIFHVIFALVSEDG
jgi:hypothetical protein